ncbi:MAG: glutamyl-tRNA reductase [Gammaproteobacteria bacterium]
MPLFVLSINHHTAPVEMREKVAFPPERLADALAQLSKLSGVDEAAILSTCNRTEIYCELQNERSDALVEWLTNHHSLTQAKLNPYLTILPGQEAVRHMLRVACGLDSMIIGEPQILGQMKAAFQAAGRAGTVHALLSKLFQHTFSVAKQIRTDTAIGASPVSVAFAAVVLAKQIFGELEQQTALLIGAGETIDLAARHLHQHNLGRMIVANRTVERARELAAPFDGYAISLAEVPAHLAEADIVISSTASQLPILGKGAVERAFASRKHRPMLIVDIAVPRDVEPEVVDLPDVYLYTVDDMKEIIDENLASRQEAAKQAEQIIDVQVAKFMGWMRSLDAVSTIRRYREDAEAVRDELLATARQQLEQNKDPQQVVEFLANSLTNKLIHKPSANLRQAGFDGEIKFIDTARKLLGVEDPDNS